MFIFSLDTILLSEVHTAFRDLLHQEYELSADWFITLPSLAYSALLRMLQQSGQSVELISDEEQ